MSMFFEIKVRVDGEEKWVNGKKMFKYLLEEYSKVNYEGKVEEPYPDRVHKFFDEMPKLRHEVKVENPKTKEKSTVTFSGLADFFVSASPTKA